MTKEQLTNGALIKFSLNGIERKGVICTASMDQESAVVKFDIGKMLVVSREELELDEGSKKKKK